GLAGLVDDPHAAAAQLAQHLIAGDVRQAGGGGGLPLRHGLGPVPRRPRRRRGPPPRPPPYRPHHRAPPPQGPAPPPQTLAALGASAAQVVHLGRLALLPEFLPAEQEVPHPGIAAHGLVPLAWARAGRRPREPALARAVVTGGGPGWGTLHTASAAGPGDRA